MSNSFIRSSRVACYVFIPTSERPSKAGAPRTCKAHIVGYDYTSKLPRRYKVIEVYADGRCGKVRSSKDVIFVYFINFRGACPSDMPIDDAYPYLATPTPHSPVSALLTTNVSTAHTNRTCARTRTLLSPCSADHPTLSGISRRYTASTASTLLSTIASLLDNGETSAPRLVLHLLTTTTSLSTGSMH